MVNYLKNDNFELVGTLPTLRRIENNDYVVIRINDQLTYRYFLLNLKTLKIDKETTEEEINGRIECISLFLPVKVTLLEFFRLIMDFGRKNLSKGISI